jgi:hypothetical protein
LCQERIFKFLDTFEFTEPLFNDYVKGLLTVKKQGHQNIKDEFKYLAGQVDDYQLEGEQRSVVWNKNEVQIQYLTEGISFEKVKNIYDNLFLDK